MRIPLVLKRTPEDTWQWSFPTLDISGEEPTREKANEVAITSLPLTYPTWLRPIEDDEQVTFVNITVGAEHLERLDWLACQAVSYQILGRQWQAGEPLEDDSVRMQPRRWLINWPSDVRPEMRFELRLFPRELGGTIEWSRQNVERYPGRNYTRYFRARVGDFVPNLNAFADVCAVLAEPPPSRKTLQAMTGVVETDES